jgi:hypothetical protein
VRLNIKEFGTFQLRRNDESSNQFWQEYEEKTGEKVLARGLGKYISGWEEFDRKGWTAIWGLIITSSGGLRFHHFPQRSWFDSLVNIGGKEGPREKMFFIPKEKIISGRIAAEETWWKKIFQSTPPYLVIQVRDETENERQLLLEVDFCSDGFKPEDLVEKLSS